MAVSRNTRLHPDAVIPIGSLTVETTDGAVTLTVPDGASGIIMQNLATNGSYWNLTAAMSGANQGFKFGTSRELVWFNPKQVGSVYLYLHASDSIVYQFVAPVAY